MQTSSLRAAAVLCLFLSASCALAQQTPCILGVAATWSRDAARALPQSSAPGMAAQGKGNSLGAYLFEELAKQCSGKAAEAHKGGEKETGTVLLKNERNVLPLGTSEFVVIGKDTGAKPKRNGLWACIKREFGKQASFVTASSLDGIEAGSTIVYTVSGEAPDTALLQRMASKDANIVVVDIAPGQPAPMPWAYTIQGLLLSWDRDFRPLCSILRGETNPDAKLPVEIRKTGTETHGGIIFPFGFGLSYTTFAYSDLKTAPLTGGRIRVSFKIKNTGSRDGYETAQLYIVPLDGDSAWQRQLVGFEKTYVGKGSEQTVTTTLERSAFSGSDTGSRKYRILVGPSSDDLPLLKDVSF
jgi:hypothetical protein